jgi:aminopeptidase N
VLSLGHGEDVFSFVNVAARPVPSLGRDFSAPVIIDYDYSEADLLHLLSFDSDPFNRWEAGQRLALNLLLEGIAVHQCGGQVQFPDSLAVAFGRVLAEGADDPAFAAEVLVLPTEMYIGEQMSVIDPAAIHHVRLAMRRFLAERLRSSLLQTYQAMTVTGPYTPDAASSGRRALRNLCLAYLMDLDEADARQLCVVQFDLAGNMTDALSALTALANNDCAERLPALERFYERWRDEPLVVDKWLAVQAMSRLPGTVAAVRSLIEHPAYSRTNPNKVYALIGSFGVNQFQFHAADGSGYALLTEEIAALDSINPQLAARMARSFERWRRFDDGRRQLMKTELQTIAALPGLSGETGEVITKALT